MRMSNNRVPGVVDDGSLNRNRELSGLKKKKKKKTVRDLVEMPSQVHVKITREII